MNKTIIISVLISVGIIMTGCTNKQINQVKNLNVTPKTSSSAASNGQNSSAVIPNTPVKTNDTNTLNNSNQKQNKQISYKQYANARFGFSIDYPDNFKTKLLPEDNDGIILSLPDGSAELTVSGINNIDNSTAESSYNSLIKIHSNASYKKLGSNWFVVSWVEDSSIIYQKSVVGSGSINTFIIKYPLSQKEVYNEIVAKLNSSFATPGIGSFH